MDVIKWYIENQPTYKRLSSKVESLLSEVFEIENISYHIVTFRTKSIDSVRDKVSKGKYSKPIEQIQDFSGIRIITYVEDEIEKICEIIEKTFNIDNANSSNKSEALGIDKVGYKSIHYVASLDKSRLKLPEYKQYIGKCFEIQVRTILQHAWAEIEHDRNYKFTGKLPLDIGRRFKILAGVLEMADREFNNISNEIDVIAKSTLENTKKGNLNIPINSTTLNQYLNTKFSSVFKDKDEIIPDTTKNLIHEIETFGLYTLADFDAIISKDIELALIKLKAKVGSIYESGLVRRILIVHDYDKYFSQIVDAEDTDEFPWAWTTPDTEEEEREFFHECGIDWSKIEKKYNAFIAF
ncbi:GTP pyrophosphokinase [Sulfurimonas sp. ST-27]|uniref:GTP pyrophosphokinase n=1 Tax=Sulfurimonas sp. ST-27 TaxID=3400152 RepID=UPI003AB6157F